MSGYVPGGTGSLIQLRPQLWLDLDGGVIIRERQEVCLTAQEAKILAILVQTMRVSRAFLQADALAERLHLTPESDGAHCVEGSICNIRRKLGEPKRCPEILICRKGFGYRLIGMEARHPFALVIRDSGPQTEHGGLVPAGGERGGMGIALPRYQ
jgi:hypothetical protein